MATTDTRSGFRLPWSSDRPHEDPAGADPVESQSEPSPDATTDEADALAWPQSDIAARLGFTPNEPRPFEPSAPQDEPVFDAADVPPAPVPAAPKKPTKLMTDLVAAIRATTEAARDQRLAQVDAEATAIVDLIRAQSSEGAAAVRRRSDEDVAAIRDWAKAEIARIREESDSRVAARKRQLEGEISSHAAAIDDRVGEVESVIAGYREAMKAYFDHLVSEHDPARLATMAEAMPEPPSLDLLADLDDLFPAPAAAAPVDAPAAAHDAPSLEAAAASDEAVEAPVEVAATTHAARWSDEPEARIGPEARTEPEATSADVVDADDTQRWAAGETPAGFPEPDEAGDPVDRGAIMAALEAAAEAVVAAEAAAESADQAEAAADVAETAAELLVGRHDADEDDPEAQAALSARVDASGFDTESFTDRLASLLPGHADGAADGEPRATQVVVNGLVSVASIASFKRHLGRLQGVTAVAVVSGPDGEFVFNVTHSPDVSFRDAIPSMSGFAARVTATGDGMVSVTARDPDSEG